MKNGVKKIQAAAYNGARMVYTLEQFEYQFEERIGRNPKEQVRKIQSQPMALRFSSYQRNTKSINI